jgi:hypothetical protein
MSCLFDDIMKRGVPGGYQAKSASNQQGGRAREVERIFFQFIKDNSQHVNQPFTVLKFHLCADSEQETRDQPMHPVSSMASTVDKYAVDSIIEDKPCCLHVPIDDQI